MASTCSYEQLKRMWTLKICTDVDMTYMWLYEEILPGMYAQEHPAFMCVILHMCV